MGQIARGPNCGKTGTVQNPHGKDHSMFIAFAPNEDPQIAMAVIVENSGYGSTWAAPMHLAGGEIFERYHHTAPCGEKNV